MNPRVHAVALALGLPRCPASRAKPVQRLYRLVPDVVLPSAPHPNRRDIYGIFIFDSAADPVEPAAAIAAPAPAPGKWSKYDARRPRKRCPGRGCENMVSRHAKLCRTCEGKRRARANRKAARTARKEK
jgi:hypothetical protein